VTKKQFVSNFPSTLFSQLDIVYFGASRAVNEYNKEYELVIVFGSFHWTPLQRLLYQRIISRSAPELTDRQIKNLILDLEKGEVLQAIERFRPNFYPPLPMKKRNLSNWCMKLFMKEHIHSQKC
jgi:hypothetical protein